MMQNSGAHIPSHEQLFQTDFFHFQHHWFVDCLIFCGHSYNIVKYNIVKYNIVKYNIVKYNIVKYTHTHTHKHTVKNS